MHPYIVRVWLPDRPGALGQVASRIGAIRGEIVGPNDVVWAPLPATALAVVVGRIGSGFRARERRQVSALARIADTRLVDFSRRAHPSGRS